MSPISALEHIAKATRGAAWREVLFNVFTSYFDRSAKDGRTVVAGWSSTVRKWLEFESLWSTVLEEFQVPYLHMKEFAHSTGPYKEWRDQETKRRDFIVALIGVIEATVMYGTARALQRTVFDIVNTTHELDSAYPNEFVFLGGECMADVNLWAWGRGYPFPSNSIRYVFERGDDGKGALTDLACFEGWSSPAFEPSVDEPENGAVGLLPLQAADFAAYEYMRFFESLDTWEEWPYPANTRKSGDMLRQCRLSLSHDNQPSWLVHRCTNGYGINGAIPKRRIAERMR